MVENAGSGVLVWQVGRRRRRLEKGFQGFICMVRLPEEKKKKKKKLERQRLFPERVIVVYFKIISCKKYGRNQHPLPDVMSSSYYDHLIYLLLLLLLNTELASDLKVLMCLSPVKRKDFKETSQMKWHTSRVWISCFPVSWGRCERKLHISLIQKSTKAFKQEWQSSLSNVWGPCRDED